jgi:hypothetical protein
MENSSTKLPIWYWLVAIFFLLWNLMGVGSFLGQVFMTDEALKALSPAEQELYRAYPFWTYVLFAIAVTGGTLGSIGLLLRKKWAKTAFVVSLVAIIPQMTYNIFFTKTCEVYGSGAVVMPVMIVIVGIFLVWHSSNMIKRNYLN